MPLNWWDLIGPAVAVAIVLPMWRRPSPDSLRESGEKFATENLAYVDSEFVERFDELGVFERRVTGVTFGCFAPVLWFAMVHGIDWDYTMSVLLLVLGVILAANAVVRLWLAGREFPAPAGRPLVARARHVRPTDYVPSLALVFCGMYVVVELAAGAISVAVAIEGNPYPSDGNPIGIAVVAFVFAAISALTPAYLSLVCRRPEAAVDSAHLYLQDAWRASDLTGVVRSLGFLAFALLGSVPTLHAAQEWQDEFILVAQFAMLASVLLMARNSKLWFRKRLWAELAPGQVIRPGETVAA